MGKMKAKSPCEISNSLGSLLYHLLSICGFFINLTSILVAKEGIHVLKLKSLGFYKKKCHGIRVLSKDYAFRYSF